MVIRRLIEAAHDRLGECIDKLTADPAADERFEDHAADPFERFRIDDNPRGRRREDGQEY